MKQFQMISEIGAFDLVFAVNAQSNYKTLKDVIDAAKAKPGKLNLGTIAVGSTQNLGAELFKSMSGADIVIVPYKNSPDIVVALLRNDVDMLLEFPPAIEGQVRDGKLRILATSGEKRSPFLPDVPTVSEAGVSGYNVTSWNGIFAPNGTPQNVVDTLNKAIRDAVTEPDVKEKFAKLGVRAEASSPDELKARLQTDIAKWGAVIKQANIPLH
jgi:tripartite-type tricarboxylate transporter receptor subunit TctC